MTILNPTDAAKAIVPGAVSLLLRLEHADREFRGRIGGNSWPGTVDAAAVLSTAHYAAAFTPPAAPYTGTGSGLVAAWNLDGTGASLP